eukprot:RCo031188
MSLAKSLGGFVKDKLVITATRLTDDEINRAILKTTGHEMEPINEKHLLRLIEASKGHYEGRGGKVMELPEILAELIKRMHVWDWVTVLKTMIVLNRLLQEAAAPMAELIIVKGRDIFNLRAQLKSLANSPEAHCEARFIRQYGRCLEERCVAAVNTRLRIEEDIFSVDQQFDRESAADALTAIDSWELVLQTVEEVEINPADLTNNPVNQEAVRCIVVDAKRFFAAISIRLIWLLNHLAKVADKSALLKQYELYTKHIEGLNRVFADARNFGVPVEDCNLSEMPTVSLERVRSLCSGGGGETGDDDVE